VEFTMARSLKLTENVIKALEKPPKGTRLTINDTGQPGLDLRITDKGAMSWSVPYRIGIKTKRYTLGRWPTILVKDARVEARDVLRQLNKGEDPQATKRKARLEPDPATVQEVGDAYLVFFGNKASERQVRLALTRDLYPALGDVPMREVTTPQIVAVLDAIQTRAKASGRKGDAMVNRVRAVFSVLWSWALERGYVEVNHVKMTKRRVLHSRDRVLNEAEVKTLWSAQETNAPYTVRMVSRLILVTAQRRSEVACATWNELDLDSKIWTIPGSRTKSGRTHRLPLSDLAVELLDEVRNRAGNSPFWFPSRWGKRRGLHPIDPNTISRFWSENAEPVWKLTNVRPHDLRRTASTAMAEMKYARREVISAILNHSYSDVTAVYVRAEMIDEQREALQSWGNYLRELTTVVVAHIPK
jgi:integrase